MHHIIVTLAAALLSACGGQVAAKPLNVCLQPSDRIAQTVGCDASIQPIFPVGEDAEEFVTRQLLQPGELMLWIGNPNWTGNLSGWRDRNFVKVLAAAAKHRDRIKYVYIVDDFNACDGGVTCLGRDDALVNEATTLAHAAGFLTLATISQKTVFAQGFTLPNIDVLALAPYYSTMDHGLDMGGCYTSANIILNQWNCTMAKLVEKGYRGPKVYVGQGFGLTTDTHAHRMMYLQLQAEAYQQSGAVAVMSYYCHYDPAVAATEPFLAPLCGTQYGPFVTP